MADPAVRVLPEATCARKIIVTGHVQGVGFRPFVYRLARQHGLHGSVRNQLGQVEIRACGAPHALRNFEADLIHRAPPLSKPRIEQSGDIDPFAGHDFEILQSAATAEARVFVPPDYFLCDECRAELHDPQDRRFRYPFINCTQCGPRYTLINALPYDRVNTSMADFPLCPDCSKEYRDPADRRFHAEPIACPSCGPQLNFIDTQSDRTLAGDGALGAALTKRKDGAIVAVKGIGGYHLMCDARNVAAVTALRQRKFRPDKPLAVMFPLAGEDGLDRIRDFAILDGAETELLETATWSRLHEAILRNYGLGWNVGRRTDGLRMDNHLGSGGTFFACMGVMPDADLAIVVVHNGGGRKGAATEVLHALKDRYLAARR